MKMRADAPLLRAHLRRQGRLLVLTSLVCAAVIAVVLWLEYRLMILALFALVPIAVVLGDWLRARRAVREGFVEVEAGPSAVVVATERGSTTVAASELGVRATPRFLVLVKLPHLWTLPGEAVAIRGMGEALAALGASVVVERAPVRQLFLFLGGVVVAKVLTVVAAGLVAGGLANIGLAVLGRGGSVGLGLLLVGGAFVALLLAALLHVWLAPDPTAPGCDERDGGG